MTNLRNGAFEKVFEIPDCEIGDSRQISGGKLVVHCSDQLRVYSEADFSLVEVWGLSVEIEWY